MIGNVNQGTSTLADLLHTMDAPGTRTRVLFPETGGAVAHRELPELSARMAARLARAGVGEGDVVGVLVDPGALFPPLLFGTWLLGAAVSVLPVSPFPAAPADLARRHAGMAARLDAVVAAGPHAAELPAPPGSSARTGRDPKAGTDQVAAARTWPAAFV